MRKQKSYTMNVLVNGDLIQVAALWTVVVALLTKFPDLIYIFELAKDVCAYIHTHTHKRSFANSNVPSD